MDAGKGGDVLMVTVELHAFPVKRHTEYEIVKYNGNVIVSRVHPFQGEKNHFCEELKKSGGEHTE